MSDVQNSIQYIFNENDTLMTVVMSSGSVYHGYLMGTVTEGPLTNNSLLIAEDVLLLKEGKGYIHHLEWKHIIFIERHKDFLALDLTSKINILKPKN